MPLCTNCHCKVHFYTTCVCDTKCPPPHTCTSVSPPMDARVACGVVHVAKTRVTVSVTSRVSQRRRTHRDSIHKL